MVNLVVVLVNVSGETILNACKSKMSFWNIYFVDERALFQIEAVIDLKTVLDFNHFTEKPCLFDFLTSFRCGNIYLKLNLSFHLESCFTDCLFHVETNCIF